MSAKKPEWLKIRPPKEKYTNVKDILDSHGLVTVCKESACPNLSECWSSGTATFMIMGDTCTRGCRFCNIKTARTGRPLDEKEPEKLVSALKQMKIFDYVVLTSVDRDDLEDEGSEHIAKCIKAIKDWNKNILVEVLIPDFKGDINKLKTVVDANPDVIAHNIETTRSLTRSVRDVRANFDQSLNVLKNTKILNSSIITKSSIMVGLGENEQEVIDAMKELIAINCDIFTLGQYLRPSKRHIELKEYITPEQFADYEKIAYELGFGFVASGPFVRSSYKAAEGYVKLKLSAKEL